jgi:hypothetical protein
LQAKLDALRRKVDGINTKKVKQQKVVEEVKEPPPPVEMRLMNFDYEGVAKILFN